MGGMSEDDVYAHLPEPMRQAMENRPDSVKDMNFEEVEKKIRPGATLARAKIAFWMEVERAQRLNVKINMMNVYKGIMTLSEFRRRVLGNSYGITYIVTPPTSYQIVVEEMLQAGLRIERETLDLPHVDEYGKIDHKLLAVKHKIIDGIHSRIKGLPVSRIHQVNQNLGESARSGQLTPDEIDAKLEALESPKESRLTKPERDAITVPSQIIGEGE